MEPQEVIHSDGSGPYATRLRHGWAVYGPSRAADRKVDSHVVQLDIPHCHSTEHPDGTKMSFGGQLGRVANAYEKCSVLSSGRQSTERAPNSTSFSVKSVLWQHRRMHKEQNDAWPPPRTCQ